MKHYGTQGNTWSICGCNACTISTSKICMMAGKSNMARKDLAGVVLDSFPNTRPWTTRLDMEALDARTLERNLVTKDGEAQNNNLIMIPEFRCFQRPNCTRVRFCICFRFSIWVWFYMHTTLYSSHLLFISVRFCILIRFVVLGPIFVSRVRFVIYIGLAFASVCFIRVRIVSWVFFFFVIVGRFYRVQFVYSDHLLVGAI